MKINILTFGYLNDIIPNHIIELPEKCTLNDLDELLRERYPLIRQANYTYAVNHTIKTDYNYQLFENDEVALLPPFSGG